MKRALLTISLAGFVVAVIVAHLVLISFLGAPARVILFGLFPIIAVLKWKAVRGFEQDLTTEPVRPSFSSQSRISHPTTTLMAAHSP